MILQVILDEMYTGKPLVIVETGCMRDIRPLSEFSDGWSTLYIARWVALNSNCSFHSVDLDANAVLVAHKALEAESIARYCTFHVQDSIKYLTSLTWVDFALLDSCDGLQHGLDEFRLAVSAGASVIVMDDYQTKAAWAVKQAQEHMGWSVQQVDRYSVLKRK
jgi:hypothetical protein